MEISINNIESIAPNAGAVKNGKDLYNKRKLTNLKTSEDGTLLFGECAGSGKNPYHCSADYIDPSVPVFRCSCPSRQFPCKHVIGLLFAHVNNEKFTPSDIPEDIVSKRAKIEKKEEKKELEKKEIKTTKVKTINKTAIAKKANAQLVGIAIAAKILRNCVQMGLSAIDAKERKALQEQIKELGNYYISGIQTAFYSLVSKIEAVQNHEFTSVIDQINYLSALLNKAKSYLNAKIENPELIELDSAIEEQIGFVWKLTDLMENGLWEENANLIQLSFNCYDNPNRKEFVDEGAWLNLKSGKIYKTQNFRPYRASKYIKEENTVYDVVEIKEFYTYPGDINPRARWDSESLKTTTIDVIQKIHSLALTNYADMVKQAKNSIKNPLLDKNPLFLIKLHGAYKTNKNIILEDEHGNKLTVLTDSEEEYQASAHLQNILPNDVTGLSMLVMIDSNIVSGIFSVRPLSLIAKNKIIRLYF